MNVRITGERDPDVPKEFVGLFIEDINYAVDGGLYAELIEICMQHWQKLVKLVNNNAKAQDIQFDFYKGWKMTGTKVKEAVLAGNELTDFNSLETEKVQLFIREKELKLNEYSLPAFSFVVLRIPALKFCQ